jgi:cell division protein FtsB
MIPSSSMTIHTRAQRYLLRTIAIAAMLGLIVYLISGLMGGERGLSAKRQLRHDIADLQVKAAALDARRAFLEKRINALDPVHPDLDMLGEQARRVLFYSEPDEVLLTPAAISPQK